MARMQWIGKLGACLAIVGMAFSPAAGDDVDQAIHGSPTDRLAAAARLREMGPPGLARLMDRVKIVEDPLLRLVENLQRSISLDTVKNEYTLHRSLHAWLAESPDLSRDVDTLNEQVYAKLFLTPSADPWLGLAPPDVYAALPNNGIVTPPAR